MSRLILVTNDDGVHAQGIRTLARLMVPFGEVFVVAPDAARSGAGCSMTSGTPVGLSQLEEMDGIHFYACSGTPVDCVKLACEEILPAMPDLLVSGINHGDNASISLHYSGTIGAVFEGCMKGIPSVGFSLCTSKAQVDFSPYEDSVVKIVDNVLQCGLSRHTCLNVNYPEVSQLQGIRLSRVADGRWETEWVSANHPTGKKSFWLTGKFVNLEPDATDTDCWALANGYGSVTPIRMDMTDHGCMEKLKTLNWS